MTMGKDHMDRAEDGLPPAAGPADPTAADGATGASAVSAARVMAERVMAALERILASADFVASPRLAAFLRFVVEATLDGRADTIKGYTIAVEALGRPASFDPQIDPIVRVEATRLRRALERYYATAGAEDAVTVAIPKGSYVPVFAAREAASAPAAAPQARPALPATVEPPAAPADAAVPAIPADAEPAITGGRPLRRRHLVGAMAAGIVLALGLGAVTGVVGPDTVPAMLGTERVQLPVVEVRAFDVAGMPTQPGSLKALEERLRDAFAQFDFVNVKVGGPDVPEASVAAECTGRNARSVYSLSGLAEEREAGTFSLLLRLADRCEGNIVWSHAIDGLKGGADLAGSEQRLVREVAGALLDSYGVVSVRARARALAQAQETPFGCLASAFSVLRGDTTAPAAPAVRTCLDRLAGRDPGFALGHAVRAMGLLDTAIHEQAYNPPPEKSAAMLREAELAVDLAPASAFAARTLALVQLFVGESEAALASGTRALALNPYDNDVAAAVGTVFIGAGRVEEGEALLRRARAQGAVHAPRQEAYLALAAFLRRDPEAAEALAPRLALRPGLENSVALALVFSALDRTGDLDEAVRSLARRTPGGAETVRRLVRHLIPRQPLAERALNVLEDAGLSRYAAIRRPSRS